MTTTAPARKRAPAKQEAAKPLDYLLKQVEIDRFNIAFTDRMRPKEPRFTLRDTSLSLTDLSGPEPAPAKLKFATTFGKETSLQAAGDLTPAPFSYRGDLQDRPPAGPGFRALLSREPELPDPGRPAGYDPGTGHRPEGRGGDGELQGRRGPQRLSRGRRGRGGGSPEVAAAADRRDRRGHQTSSPGREPDLAQSGLFAHHHP